MFWAETWKISEMLSENFQFLEVKFSIYLNKSVFVMNSTWSLSRGPGRPVRLSTVVRIRLETLNTSGYIGEQPRCPTVQLQNGYGPQLLSDGLTISTLSLWSGFFHLWNWTHQLFCVVLQIWVPAKNPLTEWQTVPVLMRRAVSSWPTL